MLQWNPWHGCHKCSPGCLNCYVYYLDQKRGLKSTQITRSKTNFNLPLKKNRAGQHKVSSNSELATCFTSDFFLFEADPWREEAWQIIKSRPDVKFLIPTKRIERFLSCIPKDWGSGYDNVIIAVSCENQAKANERLPIFLSLPIKHRYIFASPLLEDIDFSSYLKTNQIELISVGGESYENARLCDFAWVNHIYETCLKYNVPFDFHQTGSCFRVFNRIYKISHFLEREQASKALAVLKQNHLKNKNDKTC